jgi:outer membrane protein TolC
MPLGGSLRQALAALASANASVARAEEMQTRFDVQEVADTDLADAQFRMQAWSRARSAVEAQIAALMKIRRGYDLGEMDLSDVLLAERMVHDVFRSEARARAEAQRAMTRLRIDSHELWVGD